MPTASCRKTSAAAAEIAASPAGPPETCERVPSVPARDACPGPPRQPPAPWRTGHRVPRLTSGFFTDPSGPGPTRGEKDGAQWPGMISRESFARDGPAVTEPGRAREQSPSLGLDGSGNAVVAYQKSVAGDFDIKARRVS